MNRRERVARLKALARYPRLARYFRVPTHLTDAEKILLYRLAGDLSPADGRRAAIVEIGSYLGASSTFLAAGLRKAGVAGKVYCIDTWTNEAMTEGQRDTMAEFERNTAAVADLIHVVRGWSTKVVDDIASKAGTIDLLFIDGDHSYEACLADWQAYRNLLADSAVVALHDVGWAEGVQRVVSEEVAPLATRETVLPNLWWGRVKQKSGA